MNEQIKNDIQNILSRIKDGTFGQVDIKSLLIDIRNFVPNDSIIREISNFISHPEGRNRGDSCKHLKKTANELVKYLRGESNVTIRPAYTQNQIIQGLVKGLKDNAFQINEAAIKTAGDDIVFCILCLLQDVNIAIDIPGVECKTDYVITDNKHACLSATLTLGNSSRASISFSLIESNKILTPKYERGGVGQFDGLVEAIRDENGRMIVRTKSGSTVFENNTKEKEKFFKFKNQLLSASFLYDENYFIKILGNVDHIFWENIQEKEPYLQCDPELKLDYCTKGRIILDRIGVEPSPKRMADLLQGVYDAFAFYSTIPEGNYNESWRVYARRLERIIGEANFLNMKTNWTSEPMVHFTPQPTAEKYYTPGKLKITYEGEDWAEDKSREILENGFASKALEHFTKQGVGQPARIKRSIKLKNTKIKPVYIGFIVALLILIFYFGYRPDFKKISIWGIDFLSPNQNTQTIQARPIVFIDSFTDSTSDPAIHLKNTGGATAKVKMIDFSYAFGARKHFLNISTTTYDFLVYPNSGGRGIRFDKSFNEDEVLEIKKILESGGKIDVVIKFDYWSVEDEEFQNPSHIHQKYELVLDPKDPSKVLKNIIDL